MIGDCKDVRVIAGFAKDGETTNLVLQKIFRKALNDKVTCQCEAQRNTGRWTDRLGGLKMQIAVVRQK